MGSLITYPRIFSLTLGTTATRFRANDKRRALLIQNLSGNIVYISNVESLDTNQAIQLDSGNIYENYHYCQGEFYLWASAATTLVRIEEDCLQ